MKFVPFFFTVDSFPFVPSLPVESFGIAWSNPRVGMGISRYTQMNSHWIGYGEDRQDGILNNPRHLVRYLRQYQEWNSYSTDRCGM